MTYYNWLMENYAGTDTAIGDLANDIQRDELFPKNASYRGMYNYLIWEGRACQRCIQVFKESYRRYMWESKNA